MRFLVACRTGGPVRGEETYVRLAGAGIIALTDLFGDSSWRMTAPAETGGRQGVDPLHPRGVRRLLGEPGNPEEGQRLQLLGRRGRAGGGSSWPAGLPVRSPG